ncbi:MAG: ribosome biogenesis GTPase YlqF [Lachnospiraceae bacterium]|nr:ribosome biogenesis GTPase YlqF [Lachnospiraceae bacterium]
MEIQWYPGHMTKARRMMQENKKLVDLIIELVDARAPLSSRNPDIDELGKGKARVILLNKADLADARRNEEWAAWFRKKGFFAVKLDSRSRSNMKEIQTVIQEACKEKTERDRKRGILNRPVRAMVAGIPNVGKSTFINSFAGRACAKTGNKPGVTKGAQWIRLNRQVELLDTPGILWPKFDDPQVGTRLAMLGSVGDHVLNMEELAAELTAFLRTYYPGLLEKRYGISVSEDMRNEQLLSLIARARGYRLKGAEDDCARAALALLDDFRSGSLGKITLEFPD